MTRLNFLANAEFNRHRCPTMVWDSPSDGRIALLWGCEIEGPCYTATQPQVSMGDLVYKNRWPMFPLSSGWYSLTHFTLLIFALIVIFYPTCLKLHSQLSIIFFLATGAIAPVIGLPLPSGKGPSGSSSSASGTVNPLQ